MQTLDQHTQLQISDLIDACESYWVLRGVAPEQRQDMRLELEQHLAQALRDGKSLEAVIGLNPPAFAEAWAREMHPRWFRGSTLLLHGLVCALCLLSLSALSAHLLRYSPSFKLTLVYPVIFASMGLFALLVQLSGFLSPRIRTQGSRVLLVFLICCLPLLLAVVLQRGTGTKIDWNVALISWNWPTTILLLGGSLTAFGLDLWLTFRRKTSASIRRGKRREIALGFSDLAVLAVAMVAANQLALWLCIHHFG
jgi:di/tricarboxylate transporter